MPRVEVGGKKFSASEKRAQEAAAAAAAAAAEDSPARRGEEDETSPKEPSLPAQAREPEAEPAASHIAPTVNEVTLGTESESALVYTGPPAGADSWERISHAKRAIICANRALTKGMGKLERDYVLSAGRHLWEVTEDKEALKAVGFKSVEKFAESVELTRQDVYRLRRAVPVYDVIGDLVEEPLNERTIRELCKTLTDDAGNLCWRDETRRENLRLQFREMKRSGRISSAGAIAASRLLAVGTAMEAAGPDGQQGTEAPPAVEQLKRAQKSRRLVDLDLLKEVQESDPGLAKGYVDDLRERYEAAARIVEG
jgi:hypothetical protein